MMKQMMLAGAIAACLFASGCGGGGSTNSGSSSGSSGGATGTAVSVSGPLTPVQNTLSSSVLSPLASATAGTPLQGVVNCTDVVVNHNTLDILNAVLNGVTNPSTASMTPAQVQALLSEIANNLGGLLTALSGKGGCGSSSGGGSGIPTTNPLAGTPLAPLGDALLPVLQQIQGQTGSGSGGTNSLAQLATLIDQLNIALQTGLAQIPSSAKTQPVVGGVLTTLGTTVSNLASMMDAVGANNSAGFQSATQTMLDNLLVNLLTQVVPTSYIETQAGKPGTITGPIKQAAATFSSTVATALGQGTAQLLAALNNSQLAPVLSPVNTLLSAILGPINKALAGAGSGSSSGGGPTGTPLDAVLAPLTSVLGSILGSSSSTCVFANTPLSALCAILP